MIIRIESAVAESKLRNMSGRAIRKLARGSRLSLAVATVAFLIWPIQSSSAAFDSPGEYEVKAAFLFNFLKFIEWPAPTGGAIVVGIVGDNRFGDVIEGVVSGKSINGRPISVKRMRSGDNLKACHILFVSLSEKNRTENILGSLGGSSVLTVGESDRFTNAGGIIKFYFEGNRVRFEINTAAAERAQLKISSKLLGLARVVRY